MGRFRKRVLLCACTLTLTALAGYGVPVLATDSAASGAHGTTDQLAGCRLTSTAVAYHSGGVVLAPQPGRAPVPCLVATGFSGSEPQVVSLKDGTLVYEPAIITPGIGGTGFLPGAPGPRPSTSLSPGGLAISRDNGATWYFNRPAGVTWVPQDDALYTDRRTGRLFYYTLAANPIPQGGVVPLEDQLPAGEAHLMMSPDGGATWNEVGLVGFVESENPRFASAPPPAGQPAPAGYPDVVYWCGNNAVNLGLELPGYRACFRSLDGGITWSQASILDSGPISQHAECGNNAETFTDMDPNYPEGAPDGSLYAEVQCGSTTFLARSRDEAQTWPLVADRSGQPVTLPANGELRVDQDGNLYLAYQDGPTAIELRVSTDGGLTWTRPLDMAPPGVGPITQWAFAERGSEVAASYLVQRGSQSLYDGYLTVTRDALVADPIFWGAVLNPLSDPMRTSAPAQARDDFIGVDITPTGAPWGAYAASCPGPVPSANGTACAGEELNPRANEAVAGRLAWTGQDS